MLVAYDPSWPQEYESLAATIRAIGDDDWLIEHIGSTAIPGMHAKPVIDLAIRITDAADFDVHRPALEAAGWARGSAVRTHPVMILAAGDVRTAIAHFFTAAEWETVNQRILRDWLIEHPEDADRYARAKADAAAAVAEGSSAYNSAKTEVIQEIVDRARAAQGLPRVAVSDK